MRFTWELPSFIKAENGVVAVLGAAILPSDGTGYKPGWFPTTFRVEHNASTWNFYYGQWIGENGPETVYPYPI
ncbi:hypothetical protein [Brevibacillus laterosporus]|uniref:Uncharacterized protein n=1 Tax=Brevibacillus laterosporus TaxID=1465 RepID=A0AAP3DIY4_BRELA|nr:hypothetical protein [Brevibacillus laterosporus]MCR8980725.1 hypothetical protein [Brevibacillus laterosporus]MCZ0807880.1 hypothetical protein [Brevibacillus laterosporus]MCZ0826229.1 hypothetical protein [Brevibacillus laterosporus]MCZ0851240.1 hypothetical protein [Brevibacillus laterosporus]